MKTVAVVVPLSLKPGLTPDEEISLRHLYHFLGRYDRYLVAPKSLEIQLPGFKIKRFSDRFFGSAVANGRLALSRQFYEAFGDYEYILLYHLDALVLSDQLEQWCGTGLDYIGAPWIPCKDSPWVEERRVGNGGFCLRKVESFLKVIDSREYEVNPTDYWNTLRAQTPGYLKYLLFPKKYLKKLRFFNCARWEASRWYVNFQRSRMNEEAFWVNRGPHYYPPFRIASFEEGLRFAFEVAPRLCFELNGGKLPFGCHAWQRYDRDFWRPYLLK